MQKILVVLLVLWQGLFALTVEELWQEVKNNKARVETYQAEVVTTVESTLTGRQTQSGFIRYQYPDQTRTDSKQQTVLNLQGKTYIIKQGTVETIQPEAALQDSFKNPESLQEKFNFTLDDLGNGWRLNGVPRSAEGELFSSSNFSRLVLLLDTQKNITGLTLYNQSNKPVIELKTNYTTISNLAFPARTEIFLNDSKLKIITEYRQLKLNIPLDPALFDLEQIKITSELGV